MGGGALSSDCVSKEVSKEVSKICHLERSERSQSYEILRLLTRSRKTDTLMLTSSARVPQNDKYRHAELVSASQDDTVFSRFTSHFSRKPNPSQPCLGFALCSQSFTHVASQQCAQSVRYPDSLCSVRTQIRSLRKGRRKVAFTLAEVLITLGIIGVVAALTLPSVINNIKHKQLETAFKTAYSIFSQAVQNLKREDGEDIAKYYAYYDVDKGIIPNAGEFEEKFYKYSGLKVIGKCDYKNVPVMNYTNTAEAQSYCIGSSSKKLAHTLI